MDMQMSIPGTINQFKTTQEPCTSSPNDRLSLLISAELEVDDKNQVVGMHIRMDRGSGLPDVPLVFNLPSKSSVRIGDSPAMKLSPGATVTQASAGSSIGEQLASAASNSGAIPSSSSSAFKNPLLNR